MNVAAILKSKGRAVTTARSDATLLDVSSKLAAKKIGCIVIIGDHGRIAGIMSERDVIRAIAEVGAGALSEPVSRFMTQNVQTCSESTTLDELMERLRRRMSYKTGVSTVETTAAEALAALDVVGIAVHSHFNLPRREQTARIVRAMRNPHADILFHPTGRKIGQR